VKSWENLTWKFYRLSTSPVICSHCTVGNPTVIFNSIIHTYFWLFMLPHKKTIYNPLAHPTWKCHHTNLWIAKLLMWLKVCCVHSNVRGSEKKPIVGCRRWLWKEPVVMCGNSNVRHAVSQHSVQSDHLLRLYMLPVFFDTDQSHITSRCAKIQPMSQ